MLPKLAKWGLGSTEAKLCQLLKLSVLSEAWAALVSWVVVRSPMRVAVRGAIRPEGVEGCSPL